MMFTSRNVLRYALAPVIAMAVAFAPAAAMAGLHAQTGGYSALASTQQHTAASPDDAPWG